MNILLMKITSHYWLQKIFWRSSLNFEDKLDELILEGHTLPWLHSDGCLKPTLKHPYTFVRFSEEVCLIFLISVSIGRLSSLNNRCRLETDDFFQSTGDNTKKLNESKPQLSLLILIHQVELLLQLYEDSKLSHKNVHSVKKPPQMHTIQCLDLFFTHREGFTTKTHCCCWRRIIYSEFNVFTFIQWFCKN